MTEALQRLKTLTLLRRLKQQQLDDLGRQLTDIRSQQNHITQELGDLSEQTRQYTVDFYPDALSFIAQNIAAMARKKQACEARFTSLEDNASELMAAVQSAFVDAKRHEILLEAAQQAIDANAASQETEVFSEIASQRYIRATQSEAN